MFTMATSRLTGPRVSLPSQSRALPRSHGGSQSAWRQAGRDCEQIAAHGATFSFLAATSVLFFDGVREDFPFILCQPVIAALVDLCCQAEGAPPDRSC